MVVTRPARPDDDPALRALTRRCPMAADVSLRIDREPEFAALTAARGAHHTVVAERAGAIVGCVSASRRPAWVGGERSEIGVIADLKVDPEHRRAGVAAALVEALGALEAESPPAVYVAQTAAGNASVHGVVDRFSRARPVRRLCGMVSLQLLPVWPPRPPRGIEVRRAEPADRPQLEALLDAFHRPRTFAPVFGDGGLDEQLARSPGFTLADYRIALRGGAPIAVAGVWDQHALKQTAVVGMPWALSALSAVMRAGSRVLPLPRLPAVGGSLDFRVIRHAASAPGGDDGLRAIFAEVVAESRDRREHFTLLTAPEGDPRLRLAPGPHTTYRYDLVAAVNREQAAPALAALAAPYDDDAALS